jgi:hypothetical protein
MIWLKVAASCLNGREEAAAVQIAYLIPEFLNGVKGQYCSVKKNDW